LKCQHQKGRVYPASFYFPAHRPLHWQRKAYIIENLSHTTVNLRIISGILCNIGIRNPLRRNEFFWISDLLTYFMRMIKTVAVILLLALSIKSNGQDLPVITDTSYTATNGMTFVVGHVMKLGQGTLRYNRRNYFTYIYTAPWTFPRHYHLDQSFLVKTFKIKKIRTIGNDKKGHTVILVCGSGDLVNWWIEIEQALKSGEVFVPEEFKKDYHSPGRVEQDLKEYPKFMAGYLVKSYRKKF
jgi:hypothetical protein